MSDTGDENADKPREPISRPVKNNRLSKFEGIIVSRERVFDVLATIITAIFTVVLALSTVLLWKETKDLRNFAEQQSLDMRDSIREAARSADAMRDVAKALAVDAEAARANLRAYMTVGLGAVIPQDKDTGYRFEVRMTLQNVGNTPASKVAFNIYADVLPNPLPADFKFPAFNPAISGGVTTIGPHQNMLMTAIAPRIYSDDDVHEIQFESKKLLYVFGTVAYVDTFGASRYTSFCQMIIWLKNGVTMVRNYSSYNEAN